MMRRFILVLLALAGPLAGALNAQRITGTPFPSIEQPPLATEPSLPAVPRQRVAPALLVLGGLAGGAVGVFGGALIGGKLTENDCEDCVIEGIVYGAVVGGSALLPLGVHVANGRRGSFGLSLLSSLAIGGLGLAVALEANEAAVLIPVPVLQIVSSILIERATEK
jgi:hypothetical protein